MRIQSDLITEVMVKEDLKLVLNQAPKDLADELRMKFYGRNDSTSSYNVEYPPIREAISSVDVTSPSHDLPIKLDQDNLRIASALPVEFDAADTDEHTRLCQSLVCLEFQIQQDPMDSLASLRQVNTTSYNTQYEFKLAGNVHGKSLTTAPGSSEAGFVLRVRGEDIAMALMQRISDIRSKMSQVGNNMKLLERITVTAPILNSAKARFALQFKIANLKQIRGSINSVKHFLKVGAQVHKIFMQVACNFEATSQSGETDLEK